MKKWGKHYIRIPVDDVEISVAEVLEDAETEALLEELAKRKQVIPEPLDTERMIEDLREAYVRRDAMHFEVLLVRLRAAWGPGYEIAPEAKKALLP